MSNLIRKISPKNICGKLEKPSKATALYHVIGIASSTKTGNSDYGQWVALKGQFEATNLANGELSVAPICFLPEPLNSMIAAKLDETDQEGNQVNTSVQFAVEVGYKPADNAYGYEYTTKEIIESDQADPLAALRAEAKKALPAPEEKTEAEKPAKKKKGK